MYLNRLVFLASIFTSTISFGGIINWGSGWDDGTDSGAYIVDGIATTLTIPGVNTPTTEPHLQVNKLSGADQTYTITFSQPVTFELPLGGLNVADESFRNFSNAPSLVSINANHSWDGSVLAFAGSSNPDTSTLTWSGITSLSFDHRYLTSGAATYIHDASVSSVPEPSTLALLGMGGLGLCGHRWRRRRNGTAA